MTTPRWLRRQIISKKHRRRLVFVFFWNWTRSHEWARMDWTTKHTKYTKRKTRTTNGHEWTRMGWTTNGHEIHEKKIQNHEWARMDWTTKHTKYTKRKTRTTNGHEWTRISSIHYTDSLVVRGCIDGVHAFAPPTASSATAAWLMFALYGLVEETGVYGYHIPTRKIGSFGLVIPAFWR